jgi:hypothetical protein
MTKRRTSNAMTKRRTSNTMTKRKRTSNTMIDITQHTILMPSNMMNKIYEMCYHTASLQA